MIDKSSGPERLTHNVSISKKAISGAGWTAGTSYLNTGVSFLGNVLLARLLVPGDFGVFALAASLLAFVFMLAGFGSQQAIVQCHDDNITHLVPTAFWITLLIGVFLAVGGTLLGFTVRGYYDETVAQLIVFLSWLNLLRVISQVYNAILQRELLYKPIALIGILANILSFTVAVLAAWWGMGPWSLAVRETLLATITLLALRWASRYHLTRVFDWQAAKWVWNFGWRMMVSRISEVLFGSFDNLVVGTFLGATSLGHYTLAYRLAFLGQQSLQGPIQNVMFSTFASVQKSRQKLCFGFERVNFWLWRSLVPLGLLVGLTGKDLVVLIYGDKWQLAGTLFQFMFLFLTLIPLHETLKTFLIGCGCINEVVKTRAIQLSLFVPAVIAAAYWGDLLTVVLIVNMSVLLSWSLLARHAGNVVDIDWKYLALRPMIAGVVAGISGLSVSWSMTWSNTLEIVFLKGTIIIVMYSVVLLLIERKALLGEWRIIWTRLGPNMETVSP